MNWQTIIVSADNTHFQIGDKPAFGKQFIEVLKFHSPGLAPVRDETGAYHIDSGGNQLYKARFTRTFGYYCNRAAVVQSGEWFHLTEKGKRAYNHLFSWTGNYQENFCAVRDKDNNYFHIDLNGNRTYSEKYVYCGDFKDSFACVKTLNGRYRHIDVNGNFIYNQSFIDLGIFHKNFATAKDKEGWHHIDKNGRELYHYRFRAVEPFYNGYALVTQFDNQKVIIDEEGVEKLII